MIKKILLSFLGISAILGSIYFLGPKPTPPTFTTSFPEIASNLDELVEFINTKEANVIGIKSDNQARIVWADSSKHTKTPLAFVYIHGFSASHEEGAPVHANLAKKFGANLYLARLADHGVDNGDATMGTLTADKLIVSAEEALAIAQKLGDEVIVIGTSMGGALTTYLASKHPEIKAIVLYSPCIKIFDDSAELLDDQWGLQLAQQIKGSDYNDITPKNELQKKYWTMHYKIEGLVALQNFLTHAMTKETFQKITCPTFLAYYYKDEENQDKVVSVPAMLTMFDDIKTPENLKRKMAFPATGNHVIASYIMSDDWQSVQNETGVFLEKIL